MEQERQRGAGIRFPVGAGNDGGRTGRGSTGSPTDRKEVIIRLLFESAEIATFTPQEITKLENDMRTERDLKNQIAYAKEEGREGTLHQVEHQLRKRGMSEVDIAAFVQSVREATKVTSE